MSRRKRTATEEGLLKARAYILFVEWRREAIKKANGADGSVFNVREFVHLLFYVVLTSSSYPPPCPPFAAIQPTHVGKKLTKKLAKEWKELPQGTKDDWIQKAQRYSSNQ